MTHAVSTNGHGAGLALVDPAPTANKLWVCRVSHRVSSQVGLGCQILGSTPKRGHEECGWYTQDVA
jgi:hypothetical protein